MPDNVQHWRPESQRRLAVAAVESWLASLPVGVLQLGADALRLFSHNEPLAGWRLNVDFGDRLRRLDLILPAGFPRVPPKVVLVDRPPFLTWPHVEEDGVLCLLPDSAEVDFTHRVTWPPT